MRHLDIHLSFLLSVRKLSRDIPHCDILNYFKGRKMILFLDFLSNKKYILSFIFVALLSSCGGSSSSSDGSASPDTTAPTATVIFPSANTLVDGDEIIVRGTATDSASEIASVLINGVTANSSDGFQSWSLSVPLVRGANTLTVEVSDSAGNTDTSAAQIQNELFSVGLEALAIDAANNRALVVDRYLRAVVAVDLLTGQREILSGRGIPDKINPFLRPESIAIDATGNRALVIDGGARTLFSVDLVTGERSIVADDNNPLSTASINPINPGMSIDAMRNRALVVSQAPSFFNPFLPNNVFGGTEILAIDLATGAVGVLSNATIPNTSNILINPSAILVDPIKDQAIVLDQENSGSVIAIDLGTGTRTVFSSDTIPNTANTFGSPLGLALDQNNGRYVVTTSYLGQRILAVDRITGIRTVLTDVIPPVNNFVIFSRRPSPNKIAIDDNRNRAITVGDVDGAIIETVDLSTGIRETLTSVPHVPDLNNPLFLPDGAALDSNNNRLLVLNPITGMVGVDLVSGARTILTDIRSSGYFLSSLTDIEVVADDGGAFLFVDEVLNGNLETVLIRVDLSSVEVTNFSSNTSVSSTLQFNSPNALVFDKDRNRFLVVDENLLLAVDMNTGERTEIATLPSATTNIPGTPISSINRQYSSITIDEGNNRALLTTGFGTLFEVNLDTADVSIFSESSIIGISSPGGSFSNVVVDVENNRALTFELGRIISVDLNTGVRTVFSDSIVPNGNSQLVGPRGFVIDRENQKLFVSDSVLNAIFEIDLQTGERAIFSR